LVHSNKEKELMRGCAVVNGYMAACHMSMCVNTLIYKFKGEIANLFVGIQDSDKQFYSTRLCLYISKTFTQLQNIFYKNPRNCSITDINELQQHNVTTNPQAE
jgi:hypothetical protein